MKILLKNHFEIEFQVIRQLLPVTGRRPLLMRALSPLPGSKTLQKFFRGLHNKAFLGGGGAKPA
jgi:hypothetical protein